MDMPRRLGIKQTDLHFNAPVRDDRSSAFRVSYSAFILAAVLGVLAVSSAAFAASEADSFAVVPSSETKAKGALLGSEADWFYQAAALEARFNEISAAQVPYDQKTQSYWKLLDNVKAFAVVPSGTERESRGREAFSFLCTHWIEQMLADRQAAQNAREKYEAIVLAMPEEEASMAKAFFERDYERAPICQPRKCDVQAKGLAVKVSAVDWPLSDLLRKMTASVGVRIAMPDTVSGLTDCSISEWTSIDKAIEFFVPSKGLAMGGTIGTGGPVAPLRINITDPAYMSSLAERASVSVSPGVAEKPRDGIREGYVLIRGTYIPPPYVLDLREENGSVFVCVNGVRVDSGRLAIQPPEPKVPPLSEARDPEQVLRATTNRFLELRGQMGVPEAVKKIQTELDGHPSVKLAKVYANGGGALLTLKDGEQWGIEFPAANSGDKPLNLAEYKEKAFTIAKAQQAGLQDVLKAGGLIVAPTHGRIMTYVSEDARRRLVAICVAMQEVYRYREMICRALYDLDWSSDAYESSWEVMLNLRHKDVNIRIDREVKMRTED